MDLCKTNVIYWETYDSFLSFKMDMSVAICRGSNLIYFSPFSTNRRYGGLKFLNYTHNCVIIYVSKIISNSIYSQRLLPSNIARVTQDNEHESYLLIYDSNFEFHILDIGRGFVCCSFVLPQNKSVISFCGSTNNINEFAVVSSDDVCVYYAQPDKAKLIISYNILARRVVNYCNGYFLLSNSFLKLFNFNGRDVKVRDIITKNDIASFRYDSGNIVVCSHTKKQDNYEFLLISNGTKNGIRKLYEDVWDICEDWHFSVNKDGYLICYNLKDISNNYVYKINSTVDIEVLYAGRMFNSKLICIIIIGRKGMETFEINLDE